MRSVCRMAEGWGASTVNPSRWASAQGELLAGLELSSDPVTGLTREPQCQDVLVKVRLYHLIMNTMTFLTKWAFPIKTVWRGCSQKYTESPFLPLAFPCSYVQHHMVLPNWFHDWKGNRRDLDHVWKITGCISNWVMIWCLLGSKLIYSVCLALNILAYIFHWHIIGDIHLFPT